MLAAGPFEDPEAVVFSRSQVLEYHCQENEEVHELVRVQPIVEEARPPTATRGPARAEEPPLGEPRDIDDGPCKPSSLQRETS